MPAAGDWNHDLDAAPTGQRVMILYTCGKEPDFVTVYPWHDDMRHFNSCRAVCWAPIYMPVAP